MRRRHRLRHGDPADGLAEDLPTEPSSASPLELTAEQLARTATFMFADVSTLTFVLRTGTAQGGDALVPLRRRVGARGGVRRAAAAAAGAAAELAAEPAAAAVAAVVAADPAAVAAAAAARTLLRLR